jgi:uncharacterized protein involved in exopolysaccharide biosynthesis
VQEIKLSSKSEQRDADVSLDAPAGDSSESLLFEPVEPTLRLLPYLRLFWENRRLLWRCGLSAMLASAIVAVLIPVRYQSVARLMPPDDQSQGLGMLAAMVSNSGNGGLASNLLGIKNSGDLFVGILGSDTIQDHLISEFELTKVYGDSKIEDARADLAGHSYISADRKSGIISISVADHDPKRAAAIAQAYVSELNLLVSGLSTSSARRERVFLEERLQEVKTDLDSAEQKFSVFASKNTAIDIPEQGKAMVDAAATLQGQLIAAQAELSGLQQIYTNNNVRVRAAHAHVEELQKKLNEIVGAGTQSDLQTDNSLYPSIRKLPLLGVTYADLYRQTKIQQTVYEVLTQQYELAKVQEAKEIPTVKVLDPAMVPTKKSYPPRTLFVILGTILGVGLAMVWIAGKARWEASDASNPGKALAIEVFATAHTHLARFRRNGDGPGPESNGRQPGLPFGSDADDKEVGRSNPGQHQA